MTALAKVLYQINEEVYDVPSLSKFIRADEMHLRSAKDVRRPTAPTKTPTVATLFLLLTMRHWCLF